MVENEVLNARAYCAISFGGGDPWGENVPFSAQNLLFMFGSARG
jgi:hypothetical protein